MSVSDTAAERVARFLDRAGPRPGTAVALVTRDEEPVTVMHGVSDVPSGLSMGSDVQFQVGSITKAITAAAALRLASRGMLDLDAPVRDYLDWFRAGDDGGEITVRHLMTHTGGLVSFVDTTPPSRLAVWQLRDTPITSPAGARFHYSNMGYLTLGYVIEAAGRRPYADVISDEVFAPLSMRMSDPTVRADSTSLATGHYRNTLVERYDPLPRRPFVGAHASVCTTAADLGRFVRMILCRGRVGSEEFLSADWFAQFVDGMVPIGDGDWRYGLGLFVGRPQAHDRHLVVRHGGENEGFEAAMLADLDDGLGAVVLVNSFDDPWPAAEFALDALRVVRRGGGPRGRRPSPERVAAPVPQTSDVPMPTNDAWSAVTGLYRSYAPLLTDFRVLERRGLLVLESNGLYEQPLTRVGPNAFRIGVAEHELAEFDVFIGGRAQRATIGGGTYARVESS